VSRTLSSDFSVGNRASYLSIWDQGTALSSAINANYWTSSRLPRQEDIILNLWLQRPERPWNADHNNKLDSRGTLHSRKNSQRNDVNCSGLLTQSLSNFSSSLERSSAVSVPLPSQFSPWLLLTWDRSPK
jgi:hypothetical protein